MALLTTEPLRGLLDQDDEYALDSATTEALSSRIRVSLPLFKSSRSSEVVAVLQNIKMWATAAEGWLRVPVEGYALLRSLILCLRVCTATINSRMDFRALNSPNYAVFFIAESCRRQFCCHSFNISAEGKTTRLMNHPIKQRGRAWLEWDLRFYEVAYVDETLESLILNVFHSCILNTARSSLQDLPE